MSLQHWLCDRDGKPGNLLFTVLAKAVRAEELAQVLADPLACAGQGKLVVLVDKHGSTNVLFQLLQAFRRPTTGTLSPRAACLKLAQRAVAKNSTPTDHQLANHPICQDCKEQRRLYMFHFV
jgi:hypothetical protein